MPVTKIKIRIERVFVREIKTETARRIVSELRSRLDGVSFACEADDAFHCEPAFVAGRQAMEPAEITYGDALDLITIDLAEHGAKVRGVGSAAEALELLKNGPFDLLISDIGMADTDGYNLIKQVRHQESDKDVHIPAIALTAYARTQDRIRAIAAGYNTHVAKPVEIRELVTVVKCLTGRIS